jgi:hypothetical protein
LPGGILEAGSRSPIKYGISFQRDGDTIIAERDFGDWIPFPYQVWDKLSTGWSLVTYRGEFCRYFVTKRPVKLPRHHSAEGFLAMDGDWGIETRRSGSTSVKD